MDSEIGDLLEEFEAVVEEMSAQSVSARGVHVPELSAARRRPVFSDGVTDSGIEDADDGEPMRHSIIFISLTNQTCSVHIGVYKCTV